MINPVLPYHIFPLGDRAITIEFGNNIDEWVNREVMARFDQLNQQPFPGMIEIIPAYSSLTVRYELTLLKNIAPVHLSVYDWVCQQLEERLLQPVQHNQKPGRLVHIPVCYDEIFALDLKQMAQSIHIPVEDLIQIHSSKPYRVYMLGFLPGFAYLGKIDEKIAMPRKPQPVPVEAGSVGIAGIQTGIYPLASTGGWQIIGKTPLNLIDKTNEVSTFLRTGDRVQFYSITTNDYFEMLNSPSQIHGEGLGAEL